MPPPSSGTCASVGCDAPKPRGGSLLAELDYCAAVTGPGETLPELAQVVDAPGRPYLFAGGQCFEGHAAGLLGFARGHMGVGEDDGGEEVAAQKRQVIDGCDAGAGVLGRLGRPAEVAEAVAEF